MFFPGNVISFFDPSINLELNISLNTGDTTTSCSFCTYRFLSSNTIATFGSLKGEAKAMNSSSTLMSAGIGQFFCDFANREIFCTRVLSVAGSIEVGFYFESYVTGVLTWKTT